MKHFISILIIFVFIASCKKEPKTVTVSYKIYEKSTAVPTYTVRYTQANGVSKSKGGITQANWVSETIPEVELGKTVSLSVEGNGGGVYEMYIYVNGSVNAHRSAGDGYGEQTLTLEIPY
ncbi:MAG: hypothetical protein IPP64_15485 [Bacteroidetes bacterium]|nr:hypothetical protein [Bacteroidota bacterium]